LETNESAQEPVVGVTPSKLKTVMSWALAIFNIHSMLKSIVVIFFIKVDFKGWDKKQVNG